MKTPGRYEWYVLWGCVNQGGRVELDDLRENLSGHKSANNTTMYAPLYKKVAKQHKAILRAARSLHRKRLVYLEEIRPTPYSTKTKAVAVLLREKGLRAAQRYAMPRTNPAPNQVPYLSIITDATQSPIFTYDRTGKIKDEHEVHPITKKEYFQLHNTEPLEAM